MTPVISSLLFPFDLQLVLDRRIAEDPGPSPVESCCPAEPQTLWSLCAPGGAVPEQNRRRVATVLLLRAIQALSPGVQSVSDLKPEHVLQGLAVLRAMRLSSSVFSAVSQAADSLFDLACPHDASPYPP